MSIAQVEERRLEAARVAEALRLAVLRDRLLRHVGMTVTLDLSEPHALSVFGRVVSVSDDEVEIVDMSDATVPPDQKPTVRIAIVRIREVRA